MNRSTQAVQTALRALADGCMVVVVDDPDRENEGDVVMSAAQMTSPDMAFFIHTQRASSAFRCRASELTRFAYRRWSTITPRRTQQRSRSASIMSTPPPACRRQIERAPFVLTPTRRLNLHTCGDPDKSFRSARQGGVLVRAGHTEAAVDLLSLAGLPPIGVIGEIVAENGEMAHGSDLTDFAQRLGPPIISIAALVRYRRATERLIEAVGNALLPTKYGDIRAIAYRSVVDGTEHLALVMGDVAARGDDAVGTLVRVHSECLTGDVGGSLRCDCGSQFNQAMRAIAAEGSGAIIYLRGHEGRGIGLGHKLRAYSLQEQGRDTVDANLELGFPVGSGDYGVGAQILAHLGIRTIRLITNNPAKYSGLTGHGLSIVGRVSSPVSTTPENIAYFRTKRDRLGHLVDLSGSTAVGR